MDPRGITFEGSKTYAVCVRGDIAAGMCPHFVHRQTTIARCRPDTDGRCRCHCGHGELDESSGSRNWNACDGCRRRSEAPLRSRGGRVRHQNYEAAETGFRFFLTLHPGSPLTANAKYWLGECQFRVGRYKDAITSFDDALSEYPLHPKLTASVLMKKGLSFAKLGEIARSRHLLELVVVQFPDTKEAALARKSLKQPSN